MVHQFADKIITVLFCNIIYVLCCCLCLLSDIDIETVNIQFYNVINVLVAIIRTHLN